MLAWGISSSAVLTAVLGAFAAVGIQTGAKPSVTRIDRHGDSLPLRAVARLGTPRLRHHGPITLLRFSADGKTLFAGERGYGAPEVILKWRTADWKLLATVPQTAVAAVERLSLSPDCRLLL